MAIADDKWERIEKLLSDVEKTQGKALSKAEKKLLASLIDALSDGGFKNAKAADILTSVFTVFEQQSLAPIIDAIAKEIVNITTTITDYMQMQVSTSGAPAVQVEKQILKSFGIEKSEKTFKIISGGYLDKLVNAADLRAQIQRIVQNAVFGEVKFSDLVTSMEKVIVGTDVSEGALQKHFKTMAFDIMNKAARNQQNKVAEALDMQAFIYAGTVIDATRCFCKKNAGKVILKKEAEELWPDLVNEECGPRWDKDLAYNPLEDLGGHRCRHMARYISNSEAMRRDASLELVNGKLTRK